MGLFESVFNRLNSKMTGENRVIVKEIEKELDHMREDQAKEIKRLEEMFAVNHANPILTATASTVSPSSMPKGDTIDSVAAENIAASTARL